MSPKTGRPISDNPKGTMIRVRMDEETVRKLERCAEFLNTTKSEVIRIGINKVSQEAEREERRHETE